MKKPLILITFLGLGMNLAAQLSPGDLATPHAHLEGLSNCTQCHVLGNKVASAKCLECHTEINQRLSARRGYHASPEVSGKECIACHSDHHGKNFQLVRFDPGKFDHSLTGYSLSVPHAKKNCSDCHREQFINDQKLKSKKFTYLGLNRECLACHADYHRSTLSSDCLGCHTENAFKPASRFNHDKARFRLDGRHNLVECAKCHKIETRDGNKFQQFKGISNVTCAGCHKDPHQNKFGQSCNQCHTTESFLVVKGGEKFDHNKTDYKLEGMHAAVNCKQCHKGQFTDPLKFGKCTDCHSDYHNGQFKTDGLTSDCSGCHNLRGFAFTSYTIDRHASGAFPLNGSHSAVPCTDCHKKQEVWKFKPLSAKCAGCHTDIHKGFIEEKYYTGANCTTCHTETKWNEIRFDHSVTGFTLTGGHGKVGCRDCHFKGSSNTSVKQTFAGLGRVCAGCHSDRHYRQFEINGVTDCYRCHDTESWKASRFDHGSTAFRLTGKHAEVSCSKCHKPQKEGTVIYTLYKIKDFRCESCH